jgi:hypothetical protein
MEAELTPDCASIQQHCLYTLHQVIKALCSKTLAPSRKMLEEVMGIELIVLGFS